MASEPKGKMFVPVWIDAGIVKALVSDAGTIPVTESSPLASIQAQLYGDMADTWYKVRVSSGRALHTYITGQAGDVEIKQISPTDIQPGLNTQIGGAWQKQPIILGYSDTLYVQESENSDVAGSFVITSTAVPAGEVWKVNRISWYRSVNAGNIVRVGVYDGSAWINVVDYPVVAVSTFYQDALDCVLKPTQNLRFTFASATIGETCIATYWGTKTDIDL